jgi:hypothetical protein
MDRGGRKKLHLKTETLWVLTPADLRKAMGGRGAVVTDAIGGCYSQVHCYTRRFTCSPICHE